MTNLKTQEGIRKYYFDSYLVPQLDSLVYNIKEDWDFVILVTGNRMVRTGKSVLAMNICKYLAYRLRTSYTDKNIFFSGKEMMKNVFKFPKHSLVHYDEGSESLRKGYSFSNFQYNLVDFFNEVGQMNHIFVIVMPDYFDLIEQIAVARSEFLINVYRTEEKKEVNIYGEGKVPVVKFGRGRFLFFNRPRKQRLYDMAMTTKKKNYNHVRANFFGQFGLHYPIDEAAYRNKKMQSFMRFRQRKKEEGKDTLRDKVIFKLAEEMMGTDEIKKYLLETYGFEISPRYIRYIVQRSKIEAIKSHEKVEE